MAYAANVLDVMIASPSDVATERRIIRAVIADWNAAHARDRQTVLMPIGWETHSVPEMGDRPQAILNKQILKDADLLVAVFWTRIGTPTGKSTSGTTEEIEGHVRAGKPAMIYFSSAPVRPDRDEDQYRALREFRRTIQNRGLFEDYDDTAEFQAKFTRQLTQKVASHFLKGRKILPPGLEYSRPIPSIGPDASTLLIEASNDPEGTIWNFTLLSGPVVQTNNLSFIEVGNPRSEAKWRGAVKELVRLKLLEDRGRDGEMFSVTSEGYRVADLLKHSQEPG